MPDSEAKKTWIRANTKIIPVKFMLKGDADILDFLQDKPTATTIKAAIREYMENHKDENTEHKYGMRLRGYSPGAQPKGTLRREDDPNGKYHDILVYDRQLSANEVQAYDLDELN